MIALSGYSLRKSHREKVHLDLQTFCWVLDTLGMTRGGKAQLEKLPDTERDETLFMLARAGR